MQESCMLVHKHLKHYLTLVMWLPCTHTDASHGIPAMKIVFTSNGNDAEMLVVMVEKYLPAKYAMYFIGIGYC